MSSPYQLVQAARGTASYNSSYMKVVTIYSAYICIVVHYFLIMFNVRSTLYEGKTFSRLMFNLWCMKGLQGLKDASAEIRRDTTI